MKYELYYVISAEEGSNRIQINGFKDIRANSLAEATNEAMVFLNGLTKGMSGIRYETISIAVEEETEELEYIEFEEHMPVEEPKKKKNLRVKKDK